MHVLLLDLAWLAGLLEGEGCFGLSSNCSRITLRMTDLDVVEKAAKLLKSPVYKTVRGGKFKDVYSTSVFGSNAVGWMMTLYSFLSKRRRETIEKSIENWKQLRNKNPKGKGRKNPRSLAERKQNENIIVRHRERALLSPCLETLG